MSLIAVLDGLRLGFARFPLYSLLFHCRMLGGELRGHPLETRAVGFFDRDNLPWPVAGIDRWGELAFAAIDGEAVPATSTRPAPHPGAATNSRSPRAGVDSGVLVAAHDHRPTAEALRNARRRCLELGPW